MANVAGLFINPDGTVVGFQADLTSVSDFSLPGQTTNYWNPRLVELVDGESYGDLSADAGDSTKTAAQRLTAYTGSAGGPSTKLSVEVLTDSTVGTANKVQKTQSM